ncbi:MAG: hypothetical protein ABW090_15715 [Sedimenticola sp.]
MECPFCEEFATGLLPNEYSSLVPSRELHRTENFAVLADISPLLVGHLLITPIAHKLSFGAMEPELRSELDELLVETLDILNESGRRTVILEHGSAPTHDAGACIEHAHLQILPADIDFDEALTKYRPRPVGSLWETEKWSSRNCPYLYFQNATGEMVVADRLDGLPKQFIRQVAASALGMHLANLSWDWRLNILGENLVSTITKYEGRWRKENS